MDTDDLNKRNRLIEPWQRLSPENTPTKPMIDKPSNPPIMGGLSDIDDLAKRLLTVSEWDTHVPLNDIRDAAAALETLRAENALLKEVEANLEGLHNVALAECERLRAELSDATQAKRNLSGLLDRALEQNEQFKSELEEARKAKDDAEWTGYINGLAYAGNMKPRVQRGDEGARVLNDIREQIDSAILAARQQQG
jgi:hypothetical protein